jgi:type IV pilus assembly protein PilE
MSNNMRSKGFTMIELMFVVAIIAILAAIVFPSYRDQIRRASRTEARNLMVDVAAKQEKFRYSSSGYAPDLPTLGVTTVLTENGKYTLTMATGVGTNGEISSFILTATPVLPHSDKCNALTLTNSGIKGALGNGADYVVNDPRCWK